MKLKITDWIESFSYVEMVLIFVFLLFVLLPVSIPRPVALIFDSSLGMALLFFATLFFFIGTHPLLGVLFVFVAYEILRRSSLTTLHVPLLHFPQPTQSYPVSREGMEGIGGMGYGMEGMGYEIDGHSIDPLIKEGDQPVYSQAERDAVIDSMNEPLYASLEEQVVSQYGPIDGPGPTVDYTYPSFNPVAPKVQGSLFL